MAFSWEQHGGDRAGVRIAMAPPLAEAVPFTLEVVLPVADQADIDWGDVVMAARLPLFYWRVNDGEAQPLQRGINTFDLPRLTSKLEVGVFRNTQNQILNNEYVYEEETSSYPILKTVIFKMRVPEGNINLPRFGERDYELDITRLNKRKPSVVVQMTPTDAVQNAEASTKEMRVDFNEPTVYPIYFTIMDALNQPIGPSSPENLAGVSGPADALKLAVLNNPANQMDAPYIQPSAYQSGFVEYNEDPAGGGQWKVAIPEPYPLPGIQFGRLSWVVPAGTKAMRWKHWYNRLAMNQAIQASGKTHAWERVFFHFSKKWGSGVESGRHYRDSRTEIVDITYPVT